MSTDQILSIMANNPVIPRNADKGFMNLVKDGVVLGASGAGASQPPPPPPPPPPPAEEGEEENEVGGGGQNNFQQLMVEETMEQLNELKKGYEELNAMGRKSLRLAEMAKHSWPGISRAVGRNFQ